MRSGPDLELELEAHQAMAKTVATPNAASQGRVRLLNLRAPQLVLENCGSHEPLRL
jgi:hypothetical protein